MLAEASGVGIRIDVTKIPRPDDVPLERWLLSFPSFGYLLAVAPDAADATLDRFTARGIAAAQIGRIDAGHRVEITDGDQVATIWDFANQPLIGCGQEAALCASPS